ncbi:MAG: hypothetical protein NTV94_03385 [Planctomycetota bacterium]|nr:hypothetical protein [Planctomycetota bacterium]
MSTINDMKVVRVEVPARIGTALRLTVAASRRAMRAALEGDACRALFEHVPQLAAINDDVHIVFEINSDGVLNISLLDPGTMSRSTLRRSGLVQWTSDGDLLHIDAPGLLAATIRAGDASARPLFLRSSIMQSLGLGGGRYEVM